MQLEKYCKNCGANINNADQFCPDCGKEIASNRHTMRYCKNCGEKISSSENFCKNCGTKIKTPEKEKTNFLEKYKNPIILIAVIAAIAVVGIGAFSLLSPVPSQEVQVDTLDFSIPQDFSPDNSLTDDETDEGIKYVSKYWKHNDEFIEIDVMYATSNNVDANDVAREMGGDRQNMMGHNGYYNELSDAYSFSFVKDNKLVTVYTSSYDLLDEIEVL